MMKKILIFAVLITTPFAGFAQSITTLPEQQKQSIELETNGIIVKFKDEESVEQVLEEHDVSEIETIEDELLLVDIDGSASVEETIVELEKNPEVEYAEVNYARTFSAISSDDTSKNLLWAIYNTGQTVNGTAGLADADMDIDDAWGITEGTSTIVVAVIDSGVDYTHLDIADNMWDGSACKDENGIVIDGGCTHGYDYENNDADPMATNLHGTHVAGTIAAIKNNTRGIIGVAPNTKIMALRFGLDVASEVKAINFARENGVKIINASFSGTGYSQAEYDAIEAFQNAGGIFVAAASNDNIDNDSSPRYPASYNLPSIISVAATNQSDALASFSNYGLLSVDVAAPGVNILSTVLSNQYAYAQGTSMAAPHVAGLVALINAAYPSLTPTQVKALVLNTGEAKATLAGKTVTGKRVNAYNALTGFTPYVGYEENNLISSEGITHSTDGSAEITFDFYVTAGLEGLSATTTEIEYSFDAGASWATSTLGNDFVFSDNLETKASYSGDTFELVWDTSQTETVGATTTSSAMIRFKTSTYDFVYASTSPYAYSSAFDIDTIAPSLVVNDPGVTNTSLGSVVLTGESEADAVIHVFRNGSAISEHTVSNSTSTFSFSVDIDTSTSTNIFTLFSEDAWGNRSATSTVPAITYTAPPAPEPAPSRGGGGGGGGGGSKKKKTVPATTTNTAIQTANTDVVSGSPVSPALTTTTTPFSNTFTRDLTIGASGEDVRALQIYLNSHGFPVALAGVGSIGQETTLFGGLTRAALIRYQISKGIIPAFGYFGPKTRASISSTTQ